MTAVDVRPAGQAERSKLRRELRRLDTVFFLISAMVVVDTIGAIAIGGAAGVHLAAGPVAVLLRRRRRSRARSSVRRSRRRAARTSGCGPRFGRFAGALTSLLYWVGTPMWLGGSLTVVAIAVFEQLPRRPELGRRRRRSASCSSVAATLGAVVPLRYGKWVPTSGAIGQIALLVVFTGTVVVYGAQHGVHGIAPATSRRLTAFIAIVPILLYSFVGIELPSSAAEEMVDPRRDIPIAIARAGVGQLLMYAIPILAVLFVLPAEQRHVAARADRRDEDRVHRVRRFGRRGRLGDADRCRGGARRGGAVRVHLGAVRQRHGVDHGRRPRAGGGVPRRRRAAPCSGGCPSAPACRWSWVSSRAACR